MGKPTDSTAGPLVTIRGLSKVYEEGGRQRVVFRHLDASVERNELIVLLGRSGSGKSTLLNLISGIDLPTAGEVTVDDVALTALSETKRTLFRRRHIGFVFQFFNLVSTLTVEENLLLPLELNGMLDETGRAFALELLDTVGLADRAASYADRLSGGEQQRVAIARALVHKPLLLLADEPTGNLDRDTGQQTLGLLQRLTREFRATLVMVSHSAEAASLADRVFNIEGGRLLQVTGPGRGGA
ncbi:MAG: ABC transporter ATP-binding protein [Gammaproteobacteria bacterium]|nr:MAG: ABC transporter ATP-binding protein [Gammaproteobacteria bacterium]